jgi:hypothetical protein
MRSGQVEVRHILIEHALKLLLVKDQQVVKTCLSYAPGEAFADRIGAFRMKGRLEHLDGTRGRHPSKTGSKFAIIIANEILRRLPIRGSFPERYAQPRNRWEIVSRPHGSPFVTRVR